MVRLSYLTLILVFSVLRIDLVLSSKSSEEISAIIQSYADAFTTVVPDGTQQVTTQIYSSIEVQDREYVHDLTKAKNDDEPLSSNSKPTSSEEFSSISVQENSGSEEPEGTANHAVSFLEHENSQAFTTVVPDETQQITTRLYPAIERQLSNEHGHDFSEAKYDNNPALSNAPLNTAASNQYKRFKDFSSASSEESNESYEPRGPAYHVIPFSEHENPREPSTRPNYTAPGVWAKPPPDKNIPLDFLPTKLLAQVRDSHTVRHVPREYAMESAETSEEKENAARLKEVLKESKANTIYTEEGYEDAAYDHAGHIRDADFQEDFARKLNEELERNKSYSGEKKQPHTYKNHKPRKHRDYTHSNLSHNNKKSPKVAKGARKSSQKINPKHYRLLKSALNQPVINPKFAVESGIVQLEKDLRNEYREVQRTSTEPYAYTTIATPTTSKPPATESVFQSKMDYETTTMRHNVFTVRPRKTFVTVTPKPHRNKPKKPLKAFSISSNIDNYNAYTTSSYNHEPTQLPSTVDYGKLVWGYLRQNQNATPTITYPSQHFEQQSVNPLAVATVNGHGPYLVVVTAPPETITPNPSESQHFVSTVGYDAVNDYNITQPIVVDSNIRYNSFTPVNRKVNRANYNSEPQALHTNNDVSKPISYKRGKIRHRDKKPKLEKLKSQTLSEGNPNYIQGDRDSYMEYYTALQSSKNPNVPITYSNYNRQPNANWFNQWPSIFDNAPAVESYGLNGIPPIESQKPKGTSLVTRLLAPAPLSASEYATFQRQNREVKPMTATVVEIMPIIDAIHKHEHEQNSFPFLFRRKRSTFGFFRSPNFKPKERKDRETNKIENLNQVSNKSNNTKYPADFQSLLNESPHVAAKEIDSEIKRRFKNGTKAFPNKELSPEELALDRKTSSTSKENFKGGDTVEVQVPTLDFTSVFERDEIEPTTQEPRVDTKKYPFYTDSSALRNTALKYIVNPKEVPKKTLGGMEFYNSRILECEEVDPDLEKIIPQDEELVNKRGPQKKKLRLQGLGDKIDCYKAKYFDETPFDNPLFIEKDVEMPPPPTELNPKAFASRILELPAEKEEYTIPMGPKSPEFVNVKRGVKVRRPSRHHISALNARQHLHPKLRKPNLMNTQRYRYPPKNPVNIDGRMKPPETRSKMKIKANTLKVVPRYQRLVYEDVMGNIMNSDKSQKSHVPKRGVVPMYSKHYKRDNTREQGITGFRKLKTVTIDGLVPPPEKIADKLSNSKHRYNFTEGLTKNMRIYKRSTFSKDYKNLSSEETTDNVNKKDEATFRIVFTTPAPRSTPSDKQTQNSDKRNASAAKKQIHTFSHSPRHSNRSEADSGHYGKFSTNVKSNSSAVTRRKEPKYKVAQKITLPNKTSITHGDSTFASSTSIPVMVNLYKNFTARIPRGSKNNQAKKQVAEESDHDKHSDEPEEVDDNLNLPNEHEEDPKKQFVIFDPVQSKNKNKSDDDAITTYISTADLDNHKELAEFLKGNPPGYDEVFTEEFNPTHDKKKELYKVEDEMSDVKGLPKNEESHDENLEMQKSVNNEESDDENLESETGDAELDERKKEIYEESTTDDSPKEAEENEQSNDEDDEEEEKSTKDDMQEDKPFVRFSSRPESPPESFEDERYADLGPRVNKPYFYHPPFDIPTYEKYAFGKSIQDHDGDDYGHEETEYHEKYVFPWERDNEKDENKEESEHYSSLDRHEFPWEKRERKDKERQKREKMHKKYGKKNANPNYDTDSYSKASNIELVYTPSKNKYSRGKKDVNALQSDPENYSAKFSSKYKSAKIKDLMTEEKNNSDIDKSIIKSIKNINISTSKDESPYTTSRKNMKDLHGENITPDTLNKNTDALIMDSNTQKSSNVPRSSKLENIGRILSTTASSTSRSRGRTRRVNTNSIKRNETVLSDITNHSQVQPTLSPKITRQRGRNRSSATISTTTTATTTVKPNIRKRNRQAFTSTTTRTTPKSVNEKRRRGFRITSYIGSNTDSTTLPTLLTSTGRTVEREHRSRVSKEMIITKTVEDNDGDDQDEDTDKNISSRGNKKSPSRVVESSRSKIRHRHQTKNMSDSENPTKTERVEKVTITMEETPDHVYETKEIDKDGIKGKFITITANNNSVKAAPINRSRGRTAAVHDAEMEEMQRRMEAFKSFDSVIQDTEALGDEPSSLHTAEKYLVGSLLQKLPLPLSRKFKGEKDDNKAENNNNENEDEDEESVDDNEEEVDENDNEDTDSEDSSDKKVNQEISQSNNTETIEKNSSVVIKDPNNRNYYYVETP